MSTKDESRIHYTCFWPVNYSVKWLIAHRVVCFVEVCEFFMSSPNKYSQPALLSSPCFFYHVQGSSRSIILCSCGILFSQRIYLPALLLLLLFGFLISSFAHLNIKFFSTNFHQLLSSLFLLAPMLAHLLHSNKHPP